MDKLRSLEIFLATCDAGSFAAAARLCNTDPSTVSKAIARLESQLELTLFQRSTRQLRITKAGQRYADTVRKTILDLRHCEELLKQQNDSPSGRLKINAAVCYGHLYLRPVLKAFCKKYPDIEISLDINDLHVDIIEQEIDVAIRTGYVKDSRLVAKRLSPMDFLVCASPEYIQHRGIPACALEFEDHAWIGFRIKESQSLQPIFLPDSAGRYHMTELVRTHITDDGETMANLCIDGFGFAQLPHFLAKKPLANGELVSLFPYFRPQDHENGVFAIYPKREYLPNKVRVFIDFLSEWLMNNEENSQGTWAEKTPALVNFMSI